jgi:hypothetical protein
MASGGDGETRAEIRYAPYIEEKHSSFLTTIASRVDLTIDETPFADQTDIIVDDAFFGANYSITSFPTMYDMFGKFMAGLDIDVLFSQIFNDTVGGAEATALVNAESDLLQDEIENKILPGFELGARDINSVMSSAFVNGKAAIMGDAKIKSINKFSSELDYRLISTAVEKWKTHLNWNERVVLNFAQIMKFYYTARMDITDFNTSMAAKDTLWPFTVLDYERAALGTMQGATSSSGTAGSSQAQRSMSGALGGASAGAAIGGEKYGGYGAAIGGIAGLASSFF